MQSSKQVTMTGQLLAAAMLLLLAAIIGRNSQVMSAPMRGNQQAEELDDLGDDGVESPQLEALGGLGRRNSQAGQLNGDDLGQTTSGSGGNFNNDMGQQQYQNFRPQQEEQHQASNYNNALQQQASENNENNADDDNETDADDDSDFGAMGLTSANAGAASSHGRAYPRGVAGSWGADESQAMALQGAGSGPQYQGEGEIESALDGAGAGGGEPDGLDSNIANAKIEMSPQDMATAAGHHNHHHGHHVHGWLKMGAETGKKGAFKWHDKHPVGGKGRR